MIFDTFTRAGRTYYYGAIWPQGRERAADDAQIRVSTRELETLETNTETTNG
jgi:hypothetical protein